MVVVVVVSLSGAIYGYYCRRSGRRRSRRERCGSGKNNGHGLLLVGLEIRCAGRARACPATSLSLLSQRKIQRSNIYGGNFLPFGGK